MKRILSAALFLFFSYLVLQAQQSSPQGDNDYLFHLATEQFHEGEFSGCFRTIETWLEESSSPAYLEEAHFMQAVSSYELNRRETSVLLINFIRNYPTSTLTEKAFYLLGCSAMNAGQFKDALEFFRRCPEKSLSAKERIDYNFRYAYISMQLGDYMTARSIFSTLAGGESRYAAASNYFYTYIDYAEGKSKEAAEGFSKLSGHDQFSGVIPYFNAQLLYAEGKNLEAINASKELLAGNPDAAQRMEMLRLLGAASFDNKDNTSSRQYYREYLLLNPEVHSSDNYRIGVLNYIAGEYDRAETRLSEIAGQENIIGQSAAFHLGLVFLKKGNKDQALTWLEKASLVGFDMETKENALYNYALLLNESSSSAIEEKIKVFQRFLEEFPLSDKVNNIREYLAEAFLSTKDYKNALSVLNEIANPDNRTIQNKSQILFLLGIEEFEQKNFENAVQYFTQSAKLASSISVSAAEAYFWKGESLYQLKQYSEAYNDLKLFTEQPEASKMKSYTAAVYNLGYISFNLKKYTESQKWFEKFTKITGIREDERYPDAMNRLGDCYFLTKNYEKAEKYYLDADKATVGGNDYSVYQKAYAFGLRKMYQAKFDLLKQFETRFPDSERADDAIFEAGKACIALKKPDLAITTLSRLMEKYPDSPLSGKAGIQIALLYYNEGKTEEASTAYKKVIESYPGSQEAQIALSDLKIIHINNNTVSDYIDYTSNLSTPISMETGQQDSLAWFAAENLLMNGKNEEALKGFESYLNKFPNGEFVTDCHYHLGKLELVSGNNELAQPHLEYVAGQTGNRFQAEANETLADILYNKNEYGKAIEYYNNLKTISSDDDTRILALTGIIRCNYFLKNYNQVIETALALTAENSLKPEVEQEARYYRAKSYLSKGQDALAKADLLKLSSEVKTLFGAESCYLLAESYFKQGSLNESEKVIQKFIQDGTAHSYWLARGFILLSDINMQRKDYFQAKQYLTSLKKNYNADDEISGMIETRLNEIAKRNN